jgi:hypothetical protein
MVMAPLLRHVLLPALAPVAFVVLAALPVGVFGCRNRGLLVLALTLGSVIGGVVAAFRAQSGARRCAPAARWWAATALILAVPAVLLLILA